MISLLLSFIFVSGATTQASVMNPDISIIGQFTADGTTTQGARRPVDAGISDTELALTSIVDPYFRGDFIIPIARDGTVEVEEGYLTTLSLPAGLQVRLGKWRVPFGKFNPLHKHTWLTASQPLAHTMLLGPDGWKDEGAQVAWLAPLPTFHEFSISVLRGSPEVGFAAEANKRYVTLSHLRNFFEVSDDTAFEVGFSAAQGPTADCDRCRKQLGGADFILRWKPIEANARHSITLQSEALWVRQDEPNAADPIGPGGRLPSGGWFVLLDGQPALRWHFAARYDAVQTGARREKGISAIANVWPTEFSNFKLELQHRMSATEQWNEAHFYSQVLIGAHGAHPY